MTEKTKIELLGVVLLIVVLFAAVGIRGWILERDARNRAEAAAQVDDKVVQANAEASKLRDQLQAAKDAAAVKQEAAITNPAQAVQVIEHYLPAPVVPAGSPTPTPAPIPVVATSSLPQSVQAQLPNSPTAAILSQDQVQQIAREEIACQATTGDLQTCKADLAGSKQSLAAETDKSSHWEAAAKGGTKWDRLLGVAKYIGCAAGGSGVGALVDKRHPAQGAVFGGGAAVTVCSLF